MSFWTTITEGISVALDALRANKVRSGLTILGVAIGVFVVMTMAAIVTGIDTSFEEIMSSRGVTTFFVSHFDWTEFMDPSTADDAENHFMRRDPVDPRWADDLAALPGIYRVSAMVDLGDRGYEARVGETQVGISLYGVSADYLSIDNGDVIQGRWFTEAEYERRRQVAVIDSATAYSLYGALDPLGREFRIQSSRAGAPFTVVGVYRRPANLFAGFGTHWVMVPFSSADKALPVWDRMVTLVVRPEPETELQAALDVTRARLRQIRGLGPRDEDDFAMITQEEMLSVWNQLTGVLFSVMVGLSSIGLMVGGVGVIGIMMISVTERTREIGLRKSLGARQRDVLWQFLVEAATLTLLGGAIGMAFGGSAAWAVSEWTPLPASVPWWSIVAALGASALTGVGFGLYPASRAARLDPIAALRYE